MGDVAKRQLNLFMWIFWAAVFVFIVVEGALVYIVFRYRRRPGDGIPKQTHGNTKIEIAWTLAPAIVLAVVAVPTESPDPTPSTSRFSERRCRVVV